MKMRSSSPESSDKILIVVLTFLCVLLGTKQGGVFGLFLGESPIEAVFLQKEECCVAVFDD